MDETEGHTIAFERSQLAARRSEYVQALAELDAAEVRLAQDEAGRCSVCGSSIPQERRLVVPSATTCVPCAQHPPLRRLRRRSER